MMYDTRITDDSAAYSHWPLATLVANGELPMHLTKIGEVPSRMNKFGRSMGMAKAAIEGKHPSGMIYEIHHKYPEFKKANNNSETTMLFGIPMPSLVNTINKTRIKAAVPVLLEYFNIQAKYKLPTEVICENIGSQDTLIKGNVYVIDNIGRNKNLITVKDSWGQKITSRHFKIVK